MLTDQPIDPSGPRLYPRKPKRHAQMVRLPEPVRQRLRESASVLDVELSELVEAAVTVYLDELDTRRQAQGLPALPRAEAA